MLNYEDKIRKKHTLYGTRSESAVMKIGKENCKIKNKLNETYKHTEN